VGVDLFLCWVGVVVIGFCDGGGGLGFGYGPFC
jgi:hypothetical protein